METRSWSQAFAGFSKTSSDLPSWPIEPRHQRQDGATRKKSGSLFDQIVPRTDDFMAANRLCSSISLTSQRSRWRKEGYRMHHTSLGWRCFAAEAMKAAAPDDDVSDDATLE